MDTNENENESSETLFAFNEVDREIIQKTLEGFLSSLKKTTGLYDAKVYSDDEGRVWVDIPAYWLAEYK